MRILSRQLTALIVSVLFFTTCAIADEIEIKNGDRLSGEIVRHDVGSVRLKTTYAGTLTIDWADIAKITLSEPSTVLMKDGSTMEVESFNRVEDEFVLKPVGAENPVSMPVASVNVVEPEAWELGQGYDFTGKVNISIEDESGNSESNEFDLDFDLTNRWRKNSLRWFGQLEYDTTRGDTTTDKWSTMVSFDHNFQGKWYGAGSVLLKQDKFADLDLRTMIGPGIGYRFFDSDQLNLRLEGGIYYLKDNFITQADKSFWGPTWFLDYDQKVWKKRLQIYHRQMGFQSANGDSKFLWRSWTGVRVPIIAGLFGSVEYEIDYDSEPAVASETTDQTFKLKLGYKW